MSRRRNKKGACKPDKTAERRSDDAERQNNIRSNHERTLETACNQQTRSNQI